jgi:DNA-directed RNA polymerase specialized sigma24 family protein
MDATFLTKEWSISIRQRLITFFACEGCPDPENCADDTILRVIKALSKEATIGVKPWTFVYAVARNVERECRRRRAKLKESQIIDGTTPEPPLPNDPTEDLLYLCLDRCLGELSPFERALIIKYHEGSQAGDDKRNRKALADQLKMSTKQLCKQAIRIRAKLGPCITDCLERER